MMAQLLVDLLNLEEGRPGRLRRSRFHTKWEIEDWGRINQLWQFASALTRSGLGEPMAPLYRTSRGDMTLGNENWVLLLEEGAPELPNDPDLEKLKRVQRGRATRADRAQNSVAAINRNGILDRFLDLRMRMWLHDEKSSAADWVTKLLKIFCETGAADPRQFPLGEELEGSLLSLALLEALYLIYTDRYLEKCFVCSFPAKIVAQCGISACKTPYFVPPRKGVRGCPDHRGRVFRNSAAFKALMRTKVGRTSSQAPTSAPSEDWQKPLLKDSPESLENAVPEDSVAGKFWTGFGNYRMVKGLYVVTQPDAGKPGCSRR